MTLAFLTSLAHAADTAPVPADDGHAVRELVAAVPFHLDTPTTWTMTASPRSVDEGLLLELRADPRWLVPRDAATPLLYVGDTPAFPFNWDHVGGCAVVWVPGPVDLATTEIYFGSSELAERVDAARGAAEREAARRVGVRPFAPARVASVLSPTLSAHGFDEIEALAMRRVRDCTASPEDLERGR